MSTTSSEGAGGTELNSILSALAAMPSPPPPPEAATTTAPTARSAAVAPSSSQTEAAGAGAVDSMARAEASKFYNNTLSDPAWCHCSPRRYSPKDIPLQGGVQPAEGGSSAAPATAATAHQHAKDGARTARESL